MLLKMVKTDEKPKCSRAFGRAFGSLSRHNLFSSAPVYDGNGNAIERIKRKIRTIIRNNTRTICF
jgi:hypothetical protein